MGLAASQARLLLLTAKNDALELAAQMVEQERLILAQEQETIAQEYSDKTTNQIYVARVTNADGSTSEETLTLDTLAKSLGVTGGEGKAIVIADANGNPIVGAYVDDKDGDNKVKYFDPESGNDMDSNNITEALNTNGYNTALQLGLQNGAYQLYVQDTNTEHKTGELTSRKFNKDDGFYVRKATDSLDGVRSRYYTEDDAAAQAEYNTAMARVNTLDTRLENKLNQIETQKTAVEQEMESVDSLVQSNIERTFQYFS